MSHVELQAPPAGLPAARRAARPQRPGGRGLDRGRGAAARSASSRCCCASSSTSTGTTTGSTSCCSSRSASRSSCSPTPPARRRTPRGRARPAHLARVPGHGRLPRPARASAPRASSSRASTRASRWPIPVGLSSRRSSRSRRRSWTCGRRSRRVVVRHRMALRRAVLGAMAVWFVWTVAELPPLRPARQRGRLAQRPGRRWRASAPSPTPSRPRATARLPRPARSAAGQHHRLLRPARRGDDRRGADRRARLARELVGVARADRHSPTSVVGFAARREWRDERFRGLYLATTRERVQHVSVLFATSPASRRSPSARTPAEVVDVLDTLLRRSRRRSITRRFGGERGEVHGRRDDGDVQQPRRPARPRRCARPARRWRSSSELARLAEAHPGWPRLRVGVNSGAASCARWAATGSSPTRWSATP